MSAEIKNVDVDCDCHGDEFGPPSVNIAETRAFSAGPMMGTKFSRLTFLGTSSACPSPLYRNVSAMAISLSTGNVILCDCGEGTQHQIMRSASVRMSKLDLILITHLHGDHVFGIFGLLCTMTMRGRTEPVTIVGPKGVKNMVSTTLLAQGGFYTYPLHFIELNDERDNKPIDLGKLTDGIQVTAYPLKHKVTTFGYTLQEPPRPGALDPVKARALGAANQQLATLKSGQDITLADGRIVRSVDCVSPATAGRVIAIVQDTYAPLDSSMVQGAQGADIVVHEATYHRALEQKAIAHGHSTADMAGQFAARVGAKILALTHFSSRYSLKGQSSPPSAQELVSLCKKVSAEANANPPAARRSDEEFKQAATASDSNNEDLFVDDLVFEAKVSCPSVQVVAAADFLAIESTKDKWEVLEQADLTKDPVQAK